MEWVGPRRGRVLASCGVSDVLVFRLSDDERQASVVLGEAEVVRLLVDGEIPRGAAQVLDECICRVGLGS